MEPITVKYKVLDTRAKVPSYATPGSAAADLCAVLDAPLTLAPMERALVPTGLAIELPGAHSVALVYARSGLGIKHGLKAINEGDEFAIHLAVDDRAADDYGVVFIPINAFTVSFDDAHQIGLMTFSDDGFPNAAGNAGGMAAMAVVKDKNGLHECLLRTLRRSSGARFPSRR